MFPRAFHGHVSDISHMPDLAETIRRRLKDLDRNPFEAARRGGLERGFINDILQGKKRSVRGANLDKVAMGLDMETADLIQPRGTAQPRKSDYREIIGYAGADPEGAILFAEGQGTGDYAPLPADASPDAQPVEIKGYSMPFFAEDGSLVWIDGHSPSPRADMMNQVVVCQLDTGEVLIKRLQKGTEPGKFNLASLSGPLRENVTLAWVAEIISIVPPLHARRVIQRGGLAA